jgi:GST-like protein
MAGIELYTAGTGNGQRAAIAVNECGVPCTIHVLNLGQGDQKKPDYLRLNPTGRIPTLIDPDGPGGKPLTVTQSWAIMLYLCEKVGKFLPSDPVARVRLYQWYAEGAADYAATNQNIFFLGSRMPEKVPDSAVKFYEDRFVNLWRFADEQLGKTPYLTSDEITAADLAVFPIYAGRRALPDNAGLSNLRAWGDRVGARPGVQKGMKLEV